jgi:hypothetical protein
VLVLVGPVTNPRLLGLLPIISLAGGAAFTASLLAADEP